MLWPCLRLFGGSARPDVLRFRIGLLWPAIMRLMMVGLRLATKVRHLVTVAGLVSVVADLRLECRLVLIKVLRLDLGWVLILYRGLVLRLHRGLILRLILSHIHKGLFWNLFWRIRLVRLLRLITDRRGVHLIVDLDLWSRTVAISKTNWQYLNMARMNH